MWISLNSANQDKIQKNRNANRGVIYHVADTFPTIIIESTFSYYLWLGICCHEPDWIDRYLERYVSRFCFTSSFWNIFIARHLPTLVTIPLLDFFAINWIEWIHPKSIRKNSNMRSSFLEHVELCQKTDHVMTQH